MQPKPKAKTVGSLHSVVSTEVSVMKAPDSFLEEESSVFPEEASAASTILSGCSGYKQEPYS